MTHQHTEARNRCP